MRTRWLQSSAINDRKVLPVGDSISGWRLRRARPYLVPANKEFTIPFQPPNRKDSRRLLHSRWRASGRNLPTWLPKEQRSRARIRLLTNSATNNRKVPRVWDSISGWRLRKARPYPDQVNSGSTIHFINPNREALASLLRFLWSATGTPTLLA